MGKKKVTTTAKEPDSSETVAVSFLWKTYFRDDSKENCREYLMRVRRTKDNSR